MLILGERHLRVVMAEHAARYNGRRPHRGRDLRPGPTIPSPISPPRRPPQRIPAGRVNANVKTCGRVLEPNRAIEGAGGLGHLLAQQLVAAGEQVVDVQPKPGARVRLLSSGTPDKNDPNDARSVAVAALRSPARHQVRADDHAVVLRVWSRRHRQLSSLRTQAACRLHAVLCEITPGGVPKNITANRAAAILGAHEPDSPVARAWHDLAEEHLADLRRIDALLGQARKKLTVAVKASGTSLTCVFGVGPVIAATVIGDVADITRFPTADRFASYNGTAPIEVSSGSKKIYRLSMRAPDGNDAGQWNSTSGW